MIQPGQKLSEGDYLLNITQEQCIELLSMEGKGFIYETAEICSKHGIYFGYFNILEHIRPALKLTTEYNFADFKQLCDNTFNTEL